ncbi:PREDICTED: protein SIEVE ELEMENT OCCLUSION B [Theobroma cacao]|uniref:Protein SIEVE ELEMENT OCCLUSION B n=1 Tax=Theobroma cacao TaxID=3641 RepID=A0AB32VL49_THECC|nr:PREDICTED: protein SIEVE ELEMENT OCCLUSION B [Theobroma cacao]
MELSAMSHGRSDPHMFSSASGGKAIGKQIEAIHDPAGIHTSMKPVLDIVEDIFRRAAPPVRGTVQEAHMQVDASDERALHSSADELIDYLSAIINRISCEIAYRLSIGEDAHATTLAVAHVVRSYSWDAKVVLALAAFAMSYGEFLLIVQLYTTNPLAKGVALLKQLPEVLARADLLKTKFDTLANLTNAMHCVAKCVIEFKELPSQYISPEDPELSSANSDIPSAVYWTIRSTVVCASQIIGLIGMGHEFVSSTTDAWELSSLAHNIDSICSDLMEKLKRCRQRINETKDIEAYQTLLRLFDAIHIDNMKILKALIYAKDDQLPLWDGTTKQKVSIDLLRRRTVLLFISDLEIPHDEILILEQMYNESQAHPTRVESQYEVIWIPVVDRSVPFDDTKREQFESLKAMMPWYSVSHPSMIQPAVIRCIKEVWDFSKKPLVVVLDPQGRVVNSNAIHMMFIWGNLAFPFTKIREEALWKEETWRIELLADSIDPSIINWLTEGKFICLYGGEDMDWIRKFTTTAKAVAQTANIKLEMLYVGKSNPTEKVRRNMTTIQRENLSRVLSDISLIRFFWVRLESMWHSRVQHGVTVENDHILPEIMTMLSFDGSEQGWAVISRGSDELARAKAEIVLKSLDQYPVWEALAAEKGFIPALNDHIRGLRTEHHCNRLILPGTAGIRSIHERVVCFDCGKQMEKFFMYRCCTD